VAAALMMAASMVSADLHRYPWSQSRRSAKRSQPERSVYRQQAMPSLASNRLRVQTTLIDAVSLSARSVRTQNAEGLTCSSTVGRRFRMPP
jgi:hypothetical protein